MAKFNKKITDTEIRIGEVRFSFPHVFEAYAANEGDEKKFSLMLIIPKKNKEAVKLIQDAIEAAKAAGKSKWGGKTPANLKTPLRDGDEERPDDPSVEGCYFMNANAKRKPGVRVLENGKVTEPLDESDNGEDMYPGAWGAVTINMFAYDARGNKGVAAGLNNVIKTRDDERLDGGRTADQDFEDLDDFDSDLD